VFDGDITVMDCSRGRGLPEGDSPGRRDRPHRRGDHQGLDLRRRGEEVARPRGTTVRISIRRLGYDQLIDLDVARDQITMPSIPAYFTIGADTGYIRLQDFNETTDSSLTKALRS